jgi:short-subunit dehydrogenase
MADRLAIVTGASSGLGSALVIELHRRGWRVGLIARRADRLEALARDLGERAAWAAADVADSDGLAAAIHEIERVHGPCDLLVANAGTGSFSGLRRLTAQDAARVFRVNVEGVVNAISTVLPDMLARGRGHVAAVSSLAGEVGLPMGAPYVASKAAVTRFMDCLRLQARPRGVTVTTVLPGFIDTSLLEGVRFPTPFRLSPTQAAHRIVVGLERQRSRIAFPWPLVLATTIVRGLPPWIMDRVIRIVLPPPRRSRRPPT